MRHRWSFRSKVPDFLTDMSVDAATMGLEVWLVAASALLGTWTVDDVSWTGVRLTDAVLVGNPPGSHPIRWKFSLGI